jgi:hypothetical protein
VNVCTLTLRSRDEVEPILREVCSQDYPESAICVQRFDDSLNSAIRITYRISLRSSSVREPRYPLLRVVLLVINIRITRDFSLSFNQSIITKRVKGVCVSRGKLDSLSIIALRSNLMSQRVV